MSKEEPKNAEVLDTSANSTDQVGQENLGTENETVNADAVANTESTSEEIISAQSDVVTETTEENEEEEVVVADSENIQDVEHDEETTKQTTKEVSKKSTESVVSKEETKQTTKEKSIDNKSTEVKRATEAKKATEVVEKNEAVTEKVEVESGVEVTKAEPAEFKYPITIKPAGLLPIFRRPCEVSSKRMFGGAIEIIGPRNKEGFFPVYYRRDDLGKRFGYIQMTDEEVRKCQSWR